jgi:hypothetical protein
VALAISFGFTVATLAACACYLAALAHATFGRWAARDGTPTVDDISQASVDVRVASAEA